MEKDYGSLADIGKSGKKILEAKKAADQKTRKKKEERKVEGNPQAATKSQAKPQEVAPVALASGFVSRKITSEQKVYNAGAPRKETLERKAKEAKAKEASKRNIANISNAAKKGAESEYFGEIFEVEGTNAGRRTKVACQDPLCDSQTEKAPKDGCLGASGERSRATNMDEASAKNNLITTQSHRNNNRLKIMFLGGVGEIGKNMTVLEYNGDIMVIDAGLSFPGEDMPGIDVVIPDFSYLEQNRDRVRGIVITHGHEDHIGAVPFVLQKLNVPIYSSDLTIAILENKIREKKLNAQLHVTKPHDKIHLGVFTVEFITVNHSIAGAFALCINTPVGVVFHTGDFKIDFEPIDGKMIDLSSMAEIGKRGVQLLLAESTNVEREGYTASERTIGKRLETIFEDNADRRLFVATFSSNIYRVQQILDLAVKFNRKVAIVGRSMQNNIEAGNRIGCFDFPKDLFIDVEKVNKYFPKEVLVLCTGAQGEANAALSRLANGEFNKIEIGEEDTVIFSSSPIPGNEGMINRVINNLYKKGARVIHEDVHTSGHACREEIKTIHSLLKPKFFIPVHGEYRHLTKHALLAEEIGMDKYNILIPEIGDIVELSKKSCLRTGSVQSGELLVDGLGIGDADSDVLRDRKTLSEDGVVVVVLAIREGTGELLSEPYMITRGFIYTSEAERLIEEGKKILTETLKGVDFDEEHDFAELRSIIRRPLRNYFYKETGRSPMILPVIFKN